LLPGFVVRSPDLAACNPFLHLNSYLLVGLSFGFTDPSYCYFP
jgi:hypothetical protein